MTTSGASPEGGAETARFERLGSILVANGLVTPLDVERGLAERRASGLSLGDALVKLGALAQEDVEWALAERLEIPFLRVRADAIDPAIVRLLPEAFLRRTPALPLSRDGDSLVLCIADPLARRAVVEARRLTGLVIRPAIASAADIAAGLDRVFGPTQEPQRPAERAPARQDGATLARPLLEKALAAGSARIILSVRGDGFEATGFGPGESGAAQRGIALLSGEAEVGRALLGRLQALAGLPAGRPPHPIHGSFAARELGLSCADAEHTLEMDLTIVPAVRGEQAAIEPRREAAAPRTIGALGLLPGDFARLRAVLDEPQGLIVLAGEPGHGKSTLFTALLEHLADAGRRVVSLEKTVRSPSASIVQVRRPDGDAHPPEGWVDAVMRLAPEVAAFDDMPGAEACARAVRAALLGTLVLYALPLEDAVAVARFLDGLPLGAGVAAASLLGVIAVRLVRETCPQCREPATLPLELRAAVQLAGGPDQAAYSRSRGCAACDGTGTKGRRPLFEVVALDKEARTKLVAASGGHVDLGAALDAARPEAIRAQALRLAAEGVIGVDELALVL